MKRILVATSLLVAATGYGETTTEMDARSEADVSSADFGEEGANPDADSVEDFRGRGGWGGGMGGGRRGGGWGGGRHGGGWGGGRHGGGWPGGGWGGGRRPYPVPIPVPVPGPGRRPAPDRYPDSDRYPDPYPRGELRWMAECSVDMVDPDATVVRTFQGYGSSVDRYGAIDHARDDAMQQCNDYASSYAGYECVLNKCDSSQN